MVHFFFLKNPGLFFRYMQEFVQKKLLILPCSPSCVETGKCEPRENGEREGIGALRMFKLITEEEA